MIQVDKVDAGFELSRGKKKFLLPMEDPMCTILASLVSTGQLSDAGPFLERAVLLSISTEVEFEEVKNEIIQQ